MDLAARTRAFSPMIATIAAANGNRRCTKGVGAAEVSRWLVTVAGGEMILGTLADANCAAVRPFFMEMGVTCVGRVQRVKAWFRGIWIGMTGGKKGAGCNNSTDCGHVSGFNHIVKPACGRRNRGCGQAAGFNQSVKLRPGSLKRRGGQLSELSQSVKPRPGSCSGRTGQRAGSSQSVNAPVALGGKEPAADMRSGRECWKGTLGQR